MREASKQIDISEQKKLNSINSSKNCLDAGGLPPFCAGNSRSYSSDLHSEHHQSRQLAITEKLLNSFKTPESSPEGVYIYTVNIQKFKKDVQSTLFSQKPTNAEMLHKNYPNIMFFDSAWKLLDPSTW
ncbi:unnamed protein product, partial [marine sediment metagenome]